METKALSVEIALADLAAAQHGVVSVVAARGAWDRLVGDQVPRAPRAPAPRLPRRLRGRALADRLLRTMHGRGVRLWRWRGPQPPSCRPASRAPHRVVGRGDGPARTSRTEGDSSPRDTPDPSHDPHRWDPGYRARAHARRPCGCPERDAP